MNQITAIQGAAAALLLVAALMLAYAVGAHRGALREARHLAARRRLTNRSIEARLRMGMRDLAWALRRLQTMTHSSPSGKFPVDVPTHLLLVDVHEGLGRCYTDYWVLREELGETNDIVNVRLELDGLRASSVRITAGLAVSYSPAP
jgi:hypothetical protein